MVFVTELFVSKNIIFIDPLSSTNFYMDYGLYYLKFCILSVNNFFLFSKSVIQSTSVKPKTSKPNSILPRPCGWTNIVAL